MKELYHLNRCRKSTWQNSADKLTQNNENSEHISYKKDLFQPHTSNMWQTISNIIPNGENLRTFPLR